MLVSALCTWTKRFSAISVSYTGWLHGCFGASSAHTMRSQSTLMYGLSDVHKDGVPLGPKLLGFAAKYFKITKWLAKLRESTRCTFAAHNFKDLFHFMFKAWKLNVSHTTMVSFGVLFLCTRAAGEEIIDFIYSHSGSVTFLAHYLS